MTERVPLKKAIMLLVIGIIASTIIIGISSIVVYASLNRQEPLPTEVELPDQVIIDNQKNLAEVKALLDKYSNETKISVDRSGRLAVDYRVENPITDQYLRLRVFSDSEGNPQQEMFVDCYDGSNSKIEYQNLVNYIGSETCVE